MKVLGRISLQSKMVIFIVTLVFFQLSIVGAVSIQLISDILEEQMGKRVLSVSHAIATMPQLAELIKQGDPEGKIQILAETVRRDTGAQFVVVGDHTGRRYSHPNPDKLGKAMVGGDNDLALAEGKSYTSRAVGTLGPSLRGKVPIIDVHGEIVGIVSVGFLEENIQQKIDEHRITIGILTLVLIAIGVFIAQILARNFKRAIFGLEPDEIARLFKERNAILGSIREGIVAINQDGLITMINQAAKKTLGLSSTRQFLNQYVDDVIPENDMLGTLKSGESQLDCEHRVGDKEIIVNRIPIWDEDEASGDNWVCGVVSSFREKDEIDILAKELSQVQEYSEMLRRQTHEYANKLYTISGLIQLEAYDTAIQLIGSETSGYQDLLQFLVSAVPDPIIAGCILGKYNRAKELDITLKVDRHSNFVDIPEWVNREKVVTILSNLLDNAYEAVAPLPEEKRIVNLSLTDLGNDLIFEVEDSGDGIPKDISRNIYKKDFSTSEKQGKGMGLYLVKDALSYINGHLVLNESTLGGALFTVYISKRPKRYG